MNSVASVFPIFLLVVNLICDVISPPPVPMQPTDLYNREYWYTQAQQTLEKRLQYAKQDRPIAKNIIIFVGDGMSIATSTAARILRGQRRGQNGEENELVWDTFPAVALAKTYNVDAQTGESSACATAMFCGAKTNYETLGLDASARFNSCDSAQGALLTSLFDWAHHAGKSENIWDRMTHSRPDLIRNGANADVSCDSYHNYKRDVQMMRELNLDAYRFSLSWARILPNGFANQINQPGIDYYNNLINEMLKYNIKPWVTIYHWDLPQKLQDLGGWTNPLIIEWFADYARIVYEKFGDRVKMWFTINEPMQMCFMGYGIVFLAPVVNSTGTADYICYKNVVLAHAKAYYLYKEKFKTKQGGKVGIVAEIDHHYGVGEKAEYAVQMANDFEFGVFLDPIFFGRYPPLMKKVIARKSRQQGYPRSRLIAYTDEEFAYAKGTLDFFGLNYYTSRMNYVNKTSMEKHPPGTLMHDSEYGMYNHPSWQNIDWAVLDPEGMYVTLKKLREEYGNIEVYITENGWPTTKKGYYDDDRIKVIRAHTKGILRALKEGSNVKSYTVWAIMDNFEWAEGYTLKLGLYETNFTSAEKNTFPKKSAFVYKEIIRSRVVDPSYNPNFNHMWIDEGH